MKRLGWLTLRYTATFTAGACFALWLVFNHGDAASRALLNAGVRIASAGTTPEWVLQLASESRAMPVGEPAVPVVRKVKR